MSFCKVVNTLNKNIPKVLLVSIVVLAYLNNGKKQKCEISILLHLQKLNLYRHTNVILTEQFMIFQNCHNKIIYDQTLSDYVGKIQNKI